MKIGIAADHAGYALKAAVKNYLIEKGHTVEDFGTNSAESVDYPDYAHPLACAVVKGMFDFAVTICYSGNGISMVMNRHSGVRAALCWNEEVARLARSHNNANVCSLPAHFVTEDLACKIIDVFLSTEFEGGRHQRRIDKIDIGFI